MFVKVVFPYKWSGAYTYRSSLELSIGSIVVAPVRNKNVMGIVFDVDTHNDLAKEITEITEYKLSASIISFIKSVAEYNMCSFGEILALYLSKKDFKKKENSFWYAFNNVIYSVAGIIELLGKRSIKTNKDLKQTEFTYIANNIEMNDIQSEALKEIQTDMSKPVLLKGPTGSGKTNIYFSLIENILKQKRQVIIVMPEIALTYAFIEVIKKTFGVVPHIWNHKIDKFAKSVTWDWAYSGKTGIIIGSRSCLWLPFSNLGCIVVDEEHDPSYKQENSPRYHARDMAILLAKQTRAFCLLVSATPSLETWLNIEKKKYNLVEIQGSQPIKVKIVKCSPKTWLSEEMKYSIYEALHKKEQSLIFLNRRGFASNIFCTTCRNTLLCKNCSTNMIFYKSGETYCSYCGYKETIKNCNICQERSWQLYGIGIEKIHDEAKIIFPKARIAVLSSDTKEIADNIDMIHNNEVDIIIATQILSKGHNFKNLTTVGIVQGDHGLSSGDPRNTERIYQLLVQVRGRCGRSNLDSNVVIQTNDTENKLIRSIAKNNFHEWVQNEMEMRKKYELPPYFRLIRIIVASELSQNSRDDINYLYEQLKSSIINHIYPPSPTALHKYKSSFRYSMLIRYSHNEYPQKKIKEIIDKIKLPKRSSIIVDVDPYSFF